MKKFAWILLGSILLTGCSTYQEVSMMTTYSEEEPSSMYGKEEAEDVESQAYYVVEDTILNQTKRVADTFNKKYNDYYYEFDSSGRALQIDWELFQENNLKPEDSEWAEKLDEVFPGIQDFMKKVGAEESNRNPQHIVINNAAIRIKPAHLYKDGGGRSYNYSSYMVIENEPIMLVDEYFKQLAEVVPKDKFVVHTPYVMGQTKLLRFSTPSLNNRSYMTLYDEQGKVDATYYEEKAVGYQLFIEDDQIQKVRVLFNKIKDEEIDLSYFEPLLSWCKNQWNMEASELEEVNALVEQVIQGKKGSKKGSFGNYEYSYKAKQNNGFRYSAIDQSKYKEMSIELVIELKSNR